MNSLNHGSLTRKCEKMFNMIIHKRQIKFEMKCWSWLIQLLINKPALLRSEAEGATTETITRRRHNESCCSDVSLPRTRNEKDDWLPQEYFIIQSPIKGCLTGYQWRVELISSPSHTGTYFPSSLSEWDAQFWRSARFLSVSFICFLHHCGSFCGVSICSTVNLEEWARRTMILPVFVRCLRRFHCNANLL